MKLVAFCEAPADFRLVSGLVDRMLRDVGPDWLVDTLDSSPEAARTWEPDGQGKPFFDVHRLNDYAAELGVRSVYGHFNDKPGRAGAAMARKAFRIARALHKRAASEPIDAAVLVWDTDQQPERHDGVHDARDDARTWARFHIVCGFPDPEREAWLLTGFEPSNDEERQRLEDLQRALGFSPVHKAHQLRDKARGALRNIKRVLDALIGDDLEREAQCWTAPPLATLRERGADTGLAAFLAELDTALRRILKLPP